MKRDAPLQNVTAEKLLVGCLLRSAHDYWRIYDTVKAEHFTVNVCRQIFDVLADIMQSGKQCSMAVLLSRLPLEDSEGQDMQAITAALAHNAEGLSATDFADQVAETATRRRAVQIGEALIKAAKAGDRPVIDIAAESEAALLDVMHVSAPKRPRRLSEEVNQVLTASKLAHEKDIMPGYATGLPSIDEILGLIMGGDLLFIIGAQADGKSSLLAQIAAHISMRGVVLNFHNEMGADQVAARQIAAMSGLSVRTVREGSYNLGQWEMLQEAKRKLAKPEFYILSDPKLSVRSVRAHALAMKRTKGLVAVTVDQLSHIRSEGRHRDRFDRLAEVTSDFKQLALELEVPVIVAAQRTRMAQRRDDPTPQIDDCDAPSIERDADAVLAVWRKESWLRRNRPNAKAGGEAFDAWEAEIRRLKNIASVIALKLRSGEAYQQRELFWDGALTLFREITDARYKAA